MGRAKAERQSAASDYQQPYNPNRGMTPEQRSRDFKGGSWARSCAACRQVYFDTSNGGVPCCAKCTT